MPNVIALIYQRVLAVDYPKLAEFTPMMLLIRFKLK